jgi:methionyl aminopeptidase
MISIKTPQEIAIMREGGHMLSVILAEVSAEVKPGISTGELDKIAEDKIVKAGAKPAFKNYQGFPGTMCASVNEEVVHAVPSQAKKLREGDIVTLDLGLIHKGFYLDMARTVAVGEISEDAARLVRVTKKALKLGIKKVRPGVTVGDVGNTIQRLVEGQGYGIVRELCGHGIGKELHEEPQIPNYGVRHAGAKLKEGMVICIEPMVTMGKDAVKRSKDGQTFVTRDNSLAAHFEDTILITPAGSEVLTNLSK